MQTLKEKLEILLAASTQTPPSVEVDVCGKWTQYSIEAVLKFGLDDSLIRPIDPYRELKAAHAAGKVVQVLKEFPGGWEDITHQPQWSSAPHLYRIKPDEPWSLHEHVAKSFGPPPKDAKFHRLDWTADMLPEGWRPLLDGEPYRKSDGDQSRAWDWESGGEDLPDVRLFHKHLRTRRPYPQPKCRVPLEAKDVPPGSVFRLPGTNAWFTPVSVTNYGVNFVSNVNGARLFRSFDDITDYHEIKRPGEDWQPCSKEISA